MSECRSELVQKVRRGLASEQERQAFEAHLQACESCRLTTSIASDFDEVGMADSSDAARVAQIASRVRHLHQRSTAWRRRPARRAWRVTLAALALGGTAAGAGMLWSSVGSPPPAPPSPTSPARPDLVTADPPRSASTSAMGSVKEADAGAESETSKVPPRQATEVPVTAASMYRLANEARRSGQTTRAVARYQELQRRFPGSAESALSCVSLGGLLLDRGSASAALQQFDHYLERGGKKRLAAEALYGRGRALRALGRTREEAQNWQRLQDWYPDSPYRGEAARRLQELH